MRYSERVSFSMKCFLPMILALNLQSTVLAQNTDESPNGSVTRLKVGLALSGGGARGAAQVGVLKVFDREKIPVDFIAGTSFGSLVGALYCVGYSPEEIVAIFVHQDWDKLFSNTPDRRLAPLDLRRSLRYLTQLSVRNTMPQFPQGLFRGQNLLVGLNAYLTAGTVAAGYDFDRFPVPFRAVATDLLTGKQFLFKNGSLAEALRASTAMPLIFSPVEKDGMLLADGALSNNIPCDVVKQMGADFVIAIDTTTLLYKMEELESLGNIIDQVISLQSKANEAEGIRLANVVIRPALAGITFGSYTQISEAIHRGEMAAEASLPELRKLIGNLSRTENASRKTPDPKPVIVSIRFSGVSSLDEKRLLSEISSKAGKPLNINEVVSDAARLYATGRFKTVDYRLEPAGDNTSTIDFILKELPLKSVGLGIRYDRDNNVVLLAEYNRRGLFHSPSSATFSAQVGGLLNDRASLRLIGNRTPWLFLEPSAHFRKQERLDIRGNHFTDSYSDRRVGSQILVGATLMKRLEISGGYAIDRISIRGGTTPFRLDGTNVLAGIRAQALCDTLDEQEFPNRGMLLNLRADRRLAALGSDSTHTIYQGDIQRYFPLRAGSAVKFQVGAGASRGDVPFYELSRIGGYSFAETASRQFLGFDRDQVAARHFVYMGTEYRRQVYSKPLGFIRRAFVTLSYNAMNSNNAQSPTAGYQIHNGGGVGLALDTIFGPMRIASGYANAGGAKVYVSFGPSF